MDIKEQIASTLERLGYQPYLEEKGAIIVRYQLKHIFIMSSSENNENFVSMYLPQFCKMEEGNELLYMAACSKLSREAKLIKVFVDRTFEHIGASCDFYFNGDESLEINITKGLELLGIIRTAFQKCVKDLRSE